MSGPKPIGWARLDRLMRYAGVVVLTLVAIGFFQLRGDVEQISGPVCAQLRDVTDRTRFGIESEIRRDENTLALHDRGELVQRPERIAELRREVAILRYQLADTKEAPC